MLKYPFLLYNIFHLWQVQSLFKQAAVGLSFLPCNESHFLQAASFSFPPFQFCPLQGGLLFSSSDPFNPIPFVNKAPVSHQYKQFSIDSFLDWEGLHWDFCSPPSSPRGSLFLPSV